METVKIIRRRSKRSEDSDPVDRPNPLVELANRNNELKTLPEQVAQDKLTYMYWYYPGGKDAFPMQPHMHYVTKYFPYAKGGPLLVDEVITEQEIKWSEEKGKFLKTKGYRYIIMKAGEDLYSLHRQMESA